MAFRTHDPYPPLPPSPLPLCARLPCSHSFASLPLLPASQWWRVLGFRLLGFPTLLVTSMVYGLDYHTESIKHTFPSLTVSSTSDLYRCRMDIPNSSPDLDFIFSLEDCSTHGLYQPVVTSLKTLESSCMHLPFPKSFDSPSPTNFKHFCFLSRCSTSLLDDGSSFPSRLPVPSWPLCRPISRNEAMWCFKNMSNISARPHSAAPFHSG